jgi:hypothetical protein
MAIIVKTPDPAGLLKAIRKAIDDKEVVTWSYDADGDFTHEPEQWKNKAWLRPVIPASPSDEIRFNILKQKGINMSKATYGVYHGRFIEMLLSHFDLKFQNASATALPIAGDRVSEPL